MCDEDRGRTKTEISNDLAYEIRLRERHVRLYRRIRVALTFIALCGGASAFSNLFNSTPWLRGIGGTMVAAAAFLDTVFDFAAKAGAHDAARRRALMLQAREAQLSRDEFDAALTTLAIDDPGCIESLRRPALNDMLRTRGYPEYVEPLSLRERIASLVA